MYDVFIQYAVPSFGTALGGLISALLGLAIVYINKKSKALMNETNDKTAQKYIEMVTNTVTKCVIATNQTYVEALKKQNAFTKEAQEEAFKRTYDNVINILSEDCLKYLESITTDVNAYLINQIEAEVSLNK